MEQFKSEALLYIELLTGSQSTPMTFQTFDDNYARKDQSLVAVLFGTIDDVWDRLVSLNNRGAGVFITPNETNQTGREAVDVIRVRAAWIDKDQGEIVPFKPEAEPSFEVQSKAGRHSYFLLKPDVFDPCGLEPYKEEVDPYPRGPDGSLLKKGIVQESFRDSQLNLSRYFGSDPKVQDISRVMRFPGFIHFKDPSNPFMISLVSPQQVSRKVYTLDFLDEIYFSPDTKVRYAPVVQTGETSLEVLQRLNLTQEQAFKKAKTRLKDFPPTVKGMGKKDNTANRSQHTLNLAIQLVIGYCLTDAQALQFLQGWNVKCDPKWQDRELIKYIADARAHHNEKLGGRLESSFTDGKPKHVHCPPAQDVLFVQNESAFRFLEADGGWSNQLCKKDAAADYIRRNYSEDDAACIIGHDNYKGARDVVFAPSKPSEFAVGPHTYVNRYKKPTLVETSGEFPLIERILKCLCDDDEGAIRYVKHWLARKVQNPGTRNGIALLFYGFSETGKGSLEQIMRTILGPSNCASIRNEDLLNKFNSHYIDRLLIWGDEILTKDDVYHAGVPERLKGWIDNPQVRLEHKGGVIKMVDNVASWIISTNSKLPLKLDEFDRRWTIINDGFTRKNDPRYIDQKRFIKTLYNPVDRSPSAAIVEETAHFGYYLRHLEIDYAFLNEPYENTARTEMINNAQGSTFHFFQSVEERGFDVIAEEVFDFMRNQNSYMRTPTDWDHAPYGIEVVVVQQVYREYCKMTSQVAKGRNTFYSEAISFGWEKDKNWASPKRQPTFKGVKMSDGYKPVKDNSEPNDNVINLALNKKGM
jgi:hypothetical protein